MVIDQIDIPNMSITKAKYHAPIRANRDALESFEPAFERVQPEAGKTHIRRNPGAAQNGQDVFDLFDHLGLEPSTFAVDEKPLQSFVAKTLDHVGAARPVRDNPTVTSGALQLSSGWSQRLYVGVHVDDRARGYLAQSSAVCIGNKKLSARGDGVGATLLSCSLRLRSSTRCSGPDG